MAPHAVGSGGSRSSALRGHVVQMFHTLLWPSANWLGNQCGYAAGRPVRSCRYDKVSSLCRYCKGGTMRGLRDWRLQTAAGLLGGVLALGAPPASVALVAQTPTASAAHLLPAAPAAPPPPHSPPPPAHPPT